MKIAVVGGGITGSVIASELASVLNGDGDGDGDHEKQKQGVEVVLFDQGRRGPGGRASHRSVAKKKPMTTETESSQEMDDVENHEFVVVPDDDIDESAFQFDHGCK